MSKSTENSYRMKDKKDRNRRLIDYRTKHPDMTLNAIGGIFHISKGMVHRILKRGY